MKKKFLFFIFLFFYLLFSACSINKATYIQSVKILIKTPKLKYHDIGFLKYNQNFLNLQAFSSGALVLNLNISKNICVNSNCLSFQAFNEEFLGKRFYDELLKQILKGEIIFNKIGYEKLQFGFSQYIKNDEYEIIYKVSENETSFTDIKNKIKINLTKI